MGRTQTPTYVVEYVTRGPYRLSTTCWRTRSSSRIPADGLPTQRNLARHVETLNASFKEGGANAMLRGTRITSATLLRNDGSREVVATFRVTS